MKIFPHARKWTAAIRPFLAALPPARLMLPAYAVLFTALLAGLMYWHATTPWAVLPDNDYWDNIRGVITESGINLNISALLRHNNEHVVLVPKLLYAANYELTSGSNIGLLVYSLFIAASCVGLLLLLASNFLVERPWRFAICAFLFPLVMFSPKLGHTYFLAMSGTIWLTADLFVVLFAIALGEALATGKAWWLLLAVLAALLATASYSTGIYALVVLLLYCGSALFVRRLRRGLPAHWLVAAVAGAAIPLSLVLIHRAQPAGHPGLSFDLPKLAEFVLIFMGSSVADSRSLDIAAGAAIIAFGVASIVRLSAEGRLWAEVPWLVLFFFAPFNGVLTGIGRLGFGVGVADSSRYQTVAALTLCATIALVLSAMPKAADQRRSWFGTAAAIFLILLSAGILAGYSISLDERIHRNGQKVIVAIALRQGIESKRLLQASTPAPSQLSDLLPTLRSARHVPFDNEGSRCESFIGRHVPDPGSEQSVGYFDTVSIYDVLDGGQEALELSGWAEKDGRPANCVVVIDGNRLVIGAGASVLRRPDVERYRRRKLGFVGWTAVAKFPQAWPVCVLASFADSEQWYPMAKCKTIENTTRP